MTEPILGRAAELDRIRDAFSRGYRCVQLIGPPGVGKTRLAEAVLTATERSALDVRLEDAEQADSVLAGIAFACGAAIRDADVLTRVANALRARGPCLILLDNLEQLAGRVERVLRQLLHAVPTVQVVVTSRVGLDVPRSVRLLIEPLDMSAARALLLRQGTTANRDIVDSLLDRLDRLPLAIELARSWLMVISPAALIERLSTDADVFGSTDTAVLERMMAGSWSRLSDAARHVCICLACLPGGAHLETLAWLAPDHDPPAAIRELMQHQLVRRVHDPFGATGDRFVPYVPVRAYAKRQATDLVQTQVTDGLVQMAARDPEQLLSWLACATTWQVPLARIDRPLVERAWQAVADEVSERAFFIGLRLHGSLMVTGPAPLHLQMIERLRTIATALQDTRWQGWAAYLAGHARWVWHSARDALPHFEQAVDLGDRAQDLRLARAGLRWVLFCSIEADRRPARASVQARLKRLGTPTDQAERSEWAQVLAFDMHRQGQREAAHALLRRSLMDAEVLRSAGLEYVAAQNLGFLQVTDGQFEAAVITRRRAVAAADQTDGHLNHAQARLGLAEALIEVGCFDEARGLLAEAHRQGVLLGSHRVTAVALRLMGQVALEAGGLVEARGLLSDAIAGLDALAERRQTLLARGDLAIVNLLANAPADAAAQLDDLSGLVAPDPRRGWLARLVAVALRAPADSPKTEWRAGASAVLDALARPGAWTERRMHVRTALEATDEAGRCMRLARRLAGQTLAREDANMAQVPALRWAGDGSRCALEDAEPIALARRQKIKALLTLLVDARQRAPGAWLTPEVIRQSVWADASLDTMRRRLHTTIYNLRKRLLGDWLESDGDCYRLSLGLRIVIV